MKMLFITEKFPPSEGGSRIYYYNLCVNYRDGGVIVLTKKIKGYEGFDKKQNFKIIRKGRPLPNWKYYQLPRMMLPLLWAIYLVLRERIDVIHCGEFFPGGAIGFILKKLFRKPYIYYVHGEAITWFKQFRLQHWFFKILLKNADQVIAACTYAEQGLKDYYDIDSDKVTKISPGVDYRHFKADWRDTKLLHELGFEGKKIILTIGRLIERKGHDMVIRALPMIIKEVPNVVYVIGGRGYYEQKLKTLAAELKVEEHVKFLGFVPHEKLNSLYSICDIFVMANRDSKHEGPEGFGMVFTEASAAGKPVIGGRSGGTEDSILDGVTGYRVDPLNIEEIATHIIKLLKDNQLREKLGRDGRKWVERNFNWHDKARQLKEINTAIIKSTKAISVNAKG